MSVREERPDDFPAIRELVGAAFGRPSVPELVERIRASENSIPELALVAQRGNTVVGHVMVSYVTLADGDATHRALTLSPLAVAPAHQGQGIGGELVRAALERADARGEPIVILEGSPRYYPRFGFRPAGEFGITIPLPDWAPPEAAMAHPLSAYEPHIRGALVYPPAFDVLDEDPAKP
jgi:putative acetyltransferase